MKITLKKIKYSKYASQETNNFVADLYVDGRPFAIVCNDGIGGCDMHHKHEKNPQSYPEFNGELKRMYDWHRENTTFENQYDDTGFSKGSLDITVGEVLEAHLVEKEVKSLMARNMIIFEKGTRGFYKYGKKKYNVTVNSMGAFRAKIAKWHKETVCINDMPLDEAIAYFKAN